MNYNYHTHTPLCSHATGEPEAYIKRAIANGIRYMGFSDHSPLVFSDGYQSAWRVQTEDAQTYVDTIRALRDKYADEIEIKIGFEMEYYPNHFEKMLANAIELGAEYLILGPHFIKAEHEYPFDRPSGKRHESEAELAAYADNLVAAMQKGVYSYVAHPDLFNFAGDEAVYRREMRRVCAAARELGVPLEINMLGIRDHRRYPNPIFWEVAGWEQSPVTFGFDAHTAEAAYDAESIPVAEEMVKRYGLNYIGSPALKLLKR